MKVLIHANCGRVALQAILRQSFPDWDVRSTYNVSRDGADTFRKLVTTWKPDALLFQEHNVERAETFVPGTGFPAFVTMARQQIPTFSWVHPFNLALWPWATKTAADMIDKGVSNWKTCTRLIPEEAGRIRTQAKGLEEAKAAWKAGTLDFNFKARLEATQAHHEANESRFSPTVVTGPFLRQNLRKTRLWWNGNHPTGTVHLEIARQIFKAAGWSFDPGVMDALPGDWTGADGAWPHSRYDHAFFKFSYMTEDLAASADCYWLRRLTEIWAPLVAPSRR